MARESKADRLVRIHSEAIEEFNEIYSAEQDNRMQCLEDRRFLSVPGAPWEGDLGRQFENKPKLVVNKLLLAHGRLINEYRNNRIQVDFVPNGETPEDDNLADKLDGLYRADMTDSCAQDAKDNSYEDATSGGIGAWRLTSDYESDESENQRIRVEPIYDADSVVFFSLDSVKPDKSDARRAFLLKPYTPKAAEAMWGVEVATWQNPNSLKEFDWCTPDVVYVAEYYRVEEKKEWKYTYKPVIGEEVTYTDDDFENDETLEETLAATGFVETKRRKHTKKAVYKYILSGSGILEDCGRIAGQNIPIVIQYGKRKIIDGTERTFGLVRHLKDLSRLKNMQVSKLAELAAYSSREKPIFTPEQIAGHQSIWRDDNISEYAYMTINATTDANGNKVLSGPVGYTKPPQLPTAMAALLQLTESDISEMLGNQQQADKMVSNISGKAVEMIQERIDAQAFIYMDNFAKAERRCGEIWLSMAKELYAQPKRKMKAIDKEGEISEVELMTPKISEDDELEYDNDIAGADYKVTVDVGPASSSKRAKTVRELTETLRITTDPETKMVLEAVMMMSMDGEGLGELKPYFRRKLVKIGAIKPNEEEAQAMQMAQGQEDPNAVFLKAASEEAQAKASKARADVVETIASAELKQSQAAKTQAETALM
jgi:hypothetical protein